MPRRERPPAARQRPARPLPDDGDCACTPTVPCGLHFAELPQQERLEVRARVHVAEEPRSGDRPRPSRPAGLPLDGRRFFCKTCHTGSVGPDPPDGWYRIQQRDTAAAARNGQTYVTSGVYCSPACLLAGAARIAESRVTSPEHAARLHQLAEAAGRP